MKQFAVAVNMRTAEFIEFDLGCIESQGNGFAHILYIGWLQERPATAENRDHRELAQQTDQWCEKCITGAEHDGRPNNCCAWEGTAHGVLSLPSAPDISRGRMGIGPDTGNMEEPRHAQFS